MYKSLEKCFILNFLFEFCFEYSDMFVCFFIVNGVGFVMVIMDIIKFYGGELVNFLDVGGGVLE